MNHLLVTISHIDNFHILKKNVSKHFGMSQFYLYEICMNNGIDREETDTEGINQTDDVIQKQQNKTR